MAANIPIKICCVINSLGAGGMERVMSILTNGFVLKPNTEIHLILYGKSPKIFYDIDSRVVIHKTDFQFSNRMVGVFKTMRFLRRKIREINPMAVLSFGEDWNNLVLLATRKLHIPVFVSDRASPYCPMSKVHKYLRIKLYPKASGVIVQTQKSKDIFSKLYHQDNFAVIGNPIKRTDIPSDNVRENIIVSVGRLAKGKNYDRLIKLFTELQRKDWKLVIVGGDTQKLSNMVQLKKLIESYGNTDNVILAGAQSNVTQYLLKSKIFAFTSSSEGFPNVIGEALSAGLPVVSYDCVAGPSEMVHNGENGFLIPLFDDEMFKEKLSTLMNDDGKIAAMGELAKQSIQKFDSVKIIDSFFRFITAQK